MKKIISKLMGGVLLFSLSMSLTSCEGALDDILGEWSRPTPGSSTGGAVAVTSIDLDADEMKLTVGDKGQLTAKVDPAGTAVTWSSDKEEIATVDVNGMVTAVAMGTAIITAKAGDKSATCEVTVLPTLSTPLTIEAITAGTITVNSSFMKFSLNGGAKTDITVIPTDIAVAAGDKVEFYGTATFYSNTPIDGSGDGFKCKVYGNIMSLLYEDFADKTELPNTFTFNGLFSNNTKLTDASGLLLPAMTLKKSCYDRMFRGCTSLTTAPAELPATDLTGADGCYGSMFFGCTILTTAPELKATTLASGCYASMFAGCEALTTAPELKAETLKDNCYQYMFKDCHSLSSVTCLATTNLTATNCTYDWLINVAASGTFTKASGADWSGKTGFSGIPSGWSVIEQ